MTRGALADCFIPAERKNVSKLVGVMKYMDKLAEEHYPDTRPSRCQMINWELGRTILSVHFPRPPDKDYNLVDSSVGFLRNLLPKMLKRMRDELTEEDDNNFIVIWW